MAAAIAAVAVPAVAQAEPKADAAPKAAQIDERRAHSRPLVILALDQANKTGNYTVLRDLGAPGFQQANTAARLGEIFAKQRADKLDLSGVAAIDPQLSMLPQIEVERSDANGRIFPSVPQQVNFELLFAPVEGQWRLFGLSVNLGQAAPSAPMPAPSSPPAKQSEKKAPAPSKQSPAPPKQ